MSFAAPPATAMDAEASRADGGTAGREACPLCGALLASDQDWCLRCGAPARTRLAAPAKWKGLVAGIVIVVVISLAVLTVALVRLAG